MASKFRAPRTGRSLPATVCAALALACVNPASAAERDFFSAAARVTDAELSGLRGGFVVPGAFIDVGIEARLSIDGQTIPPMSFSFSFSGSGDGTGGPFRITRDNGDFRQLASRLDIAQNGDVTEGGSAIPGGTGIFSSISNGLSNVAIRQVIDVNINTNMVAIGRSGTADTTRSMIDTRNALSRLD